MSEPLPELVNSIKKIEGVIGVEGSGGLLLIGCDKDLRPQIAKTIVDSNTLLVQMKIEEYGLEEIYLKYFRES